MIYQFWEDQEVAQEGYVITFWLCSENLYLGLKCKQMI